jgi:HD superfamily phosphohydrolase
MCPGFVMPGYVKDMLDPLYGSMRWHNDLCWDLFRSEPLTRLRDISLSSVPSQMSHAGQASSRFEHSLGIAHLAHELCKREAFREYHDELIVAALLHDSASAPFSHTAEIFYEDMTGYTHEEAVIDIIDSPEIVKVLRKHGVSGERVLQLVLGNHPTLQSILAGGIDLDNLDNSLRLARAFGAYADQPLPYNPLLLLRAFRLGSGGLSLSSSYLTQLTGWLECRQTLYDKVLYQDHKLAPASMLYRALETCYDQGLLKESFFRMGEGEAMLYLLHGASDSAKELIDNALHWRHYQPLWRNQGNDEYLKRLTNDWWLAKSLADGIAKNLKCKPHHIALTANRSRSHKPIHLPFTGEWAGACESIFRRDQDKYTLAVYKKHSTKPLSLDRVDDAIAQALSDIS